MKLSPYSSDFESKKRAMTLGRICVIAGAHVLIIGGGYLVTQFGSDVRTDERSSLAGATWSSQSSNADAPTVDSAAGSLFDSRSGNLAGYNAGDGRSAMLASNGAPKSGRFPPRRPSEVQSSSDPSPAPRENRRTNDEVLRPVNDRNANDSFDDRSGDSGMIEYTVQNGDSIFAISQRFDVSMRDITSANPGIKADSIRVGQTIRVPRASSSASQQSAPAQVEQPESPASTSGGSVYTVKKGDSLSEIASRQGVTVAELRSANGLRGDMIRIGQELKIPASSRSARDLPPQYKGPKVTVEAGDTLGEIAAVHGVSVSDLMKLNDIRDARTIRIGQVILIPDTGSRRRANNETRPAQNELPQQREPQPKPPASSQTRPLQTLDTLEFDEEEEPLRSLDSLQGEFSEEDLEEQPLIPIQE